MGWLKQIFRWRQASFGEEFAKAALGGQRRHGRSRSDQEFFDAYCSQLRRIYSDGGFRYGVSTSEVICVATEVSRLIVAAQEIEARLAAIEARLEPKH